MNHQKWTKKKLILLYRQLHQKIGYQPTRKLWVEDANTPSDMPIRYLFGSWNSFINEIGLRIYIPKPPGKPKGSKNKGELKRIISHGYIHLFKPDHIEAMKNGYVREHRMIMSDHLGKKLLIHEEIHHKNEIKHDNRICNLEIKAKDDHTSYHHKDKLKPRRNRSICNYKDCTILQKSKYGLCTKHYKLQWQREKLNIFEHKELLK